MSLPERVALAIEPTPGPLDTPCHIWTGALSQRGYGICIHRNKRVSVHRALYVEVVGDPGAEMTLDHRCATPRCVNPEHLEPVTNRRNVQLGFLRRGIGTAASETSCIHGHEMTPENTRIEKDGRRCCRACNRRRSLEYVRRKQCRTG